MPIPPEGRFSLQLGDSFFNVNSVAKRAYPVPLDIDWGTQSYTGAVFGAVALFMALISRCRLIRNRCRSMRS